MSRTKKEIVSAEIHRKAGPMRDRKKDNAPMLCPDCEGLPLVDEMGQEWVCPTCDGECIVYE